MSEPISEEESGLSAQPAPRVPASLLVRLRQATGGERQALDLDAIARAPRDARWEDSLVRAARDAGLDPRALSLDVDAALASARREAPLVSWREGVGWIVLAADRRGRPVLGVGDADPSRTDADALRAVLGPTTDESSWVLVRAGLPTGRPRPDGRPAPFARLLDILHPERGDILAIALYAVFIGLLSLAIPIAVQQLVNSVAFGGLVQPVVVLAFLLFLGLGFGAFLSTCQAFLAELLQRRVFVRACVQLADRLPRVQRTAFDGAHGPEQVNRFFDLVTLQKTGAQLLLEGSAVLLQTFTGIMILSFYHPLMLGLSVLLIATMGFVVFGLGRGAAGTALAESSAKYALAAWLEELSRHGAAFRSGSSREHAAERADALATSWIAARTTHYRLVLRQLIGALGLQVMVNTLVLALGGILVVIGELTLGQLVASEIIVAAVVGAFARLGKQLESFYDLLAAVEKVGSLYDLPLERIDGRPRTRRTESVALEAIGLDYAYGSGSALEPIDLRIEAGERLALTGPPASGKTTLADLLCGIREPRSGRVEIDGEDTRELALDSLREQLICIREPEIFSGTIRENLWIARRDVRPDEIDAALRSVGLLDELRALPEGLDSMVSTDGAPLSRSQIARLMFARALVAHPSVLVVDGELPFVEGPEREALLDALFAAERPFTLIVVSARDDVVARCDRVVTLADPRRPRIVHAEAPHAAESSHA